MIKKLRTKMIIVSTLSVLAVLVVILGVINGVTFYNINQRADELIHILAENGGRFPKLVEGEPIQPKKDRHNVSPETPYETRFFTVYVDRSGRALAADTGSIAAINTAVATEMAEKAYASGRSDGFIQDYKYSVSKNGDKAMIVFLDCGRDLRTFRSFLVTSLMVAAAGLVGVFVLVYVLSKFAIKPLAESYEKQKRFITDASHEIKTPLTIIGANTEIIEMQSGESEWTQSTRNQIRRLTELTVQLVSLARMDEENAKLPMVDFSLSDAVQEEAEPFVPLAQTSGKTLMLEIEDGISCFGDESALRKVVSILLENAIRYSDAEGKISLKLSRQGKKNRLWVSNTVNGIEPGSHDIMFERFYRADSSRNSKAGGYGIGLSIAQSIIEQHKGKLTAHSKDTRSIEFTALF